MVKIKPCRLSKQLDSVTEKPFVFCGYKVSHVIGENTHSRNISSVHGFCNLSVIKAKLLSSSNNADTETEVFHRFQQKQNVKFLYQAKVKKQIGYKYQSQLFRTNQYFIVDIFPRGKSCFVKLKIVSMAERIKR